MAVQPPAKKAIMSLTRVGCAQMFFIYTGRANRAVNFFDLVRATGLADRNLALIRDLAAANYSRGVSPDLPDLDSLVGWHQEHLRSHPHVTEAYHIGNSSGGYGAMLFGYLLGSRKVFAFAPRTAQLATADAAKGVLRDLLSAPNGVTEYVIHFAPGNARDRAFAEYYEGVPGVVLRPYLGTAPGTWNHLVMNSLIEAGEMRGLMPPFVAAPARAGAQA